MSLTRLQPNSVIKTANYTFGNVTANYFVGDGSQLTGIAVSGGTAITNGTSNVAVALNGNVTVGVSGTNDVLTITTNKIEVAGNVSATYFIGNGSQLTGITGGGSTYANSNVADYLPTYTGNVSANYFIGNGSRLTSVTGANITGYVLNATNANTATIAGTVTTAAQPNITSVGTLSSLSVSGLITATGTGVKVANIQDSTGTITITTKYNDVAGDVGVYGNITAGTNGSGNVTATYFIGNGSQLTGLPASYSNTNVAAYLPTYTGNVAGNYFIGNGSQLTNITVSTATTAETVTTNAQPNITSVGTLTNLIVSGNATVGSGVGGSITGGNLLSANYVSGTLTTAAQPNITSVGSLTSLNVTGYANFTDTTTFRSSQDVTISGTPSGTVNYDLYNGILFDVSPTANWTANVGNIPTTNNRTTVVIFIITQGSTAYVPNVFQISGVTQTVKWLNNTTPSGTSNKIDVVSFSLIRSDGSTWTVLGQSATYG